MDHLANLPAHAAAIATEALAVREEGKGDLGSFGTGSDLRRHGLPSDAAHDTPPPVNADSDSDIGSAVLGDV